MRSSSSKVRVWLGAWAVWALLAAPLSAQDNPELGEGEGGGGEPPPVEGARMGSTWQPPTGQVDNSAGAAAPEAGIDSNGEFAGAANMAIAPAKSDDDDDGDDEAEQDDGKSDHQKMVGHVGVGFFGTLTVPVMGCDPVLNCPAPDDGASIVAPTIGARWWWKRRIGFELALGFNHTSGDTETVVDNGDPMMEPVPTLTVGPTVTAFAMHAGVPFAVADSGHFVFQVIPELNFGIAGGSYEGATSDLDTSISGSAVEFGARIGAEIHFGFIGIPQLALQGTIGLHIRHESRSSEQVGNQMPVPPETFSPHTTSEQSRTVFSTTVQGEPWEIFGGAITAIYYL